MIIKISKNVPIDESVFEYVEESLPTRIINWCIDSKYRKSVHLSNWLNSQLENITLAEVVLDIPTREDSDEQVIECLRWVKNNIYYKKDSDNWSYEEKWQTANETLTRWFKTVNGKKVFHKISDTKPTDVLNPVRCGDCEDGAILLYLLCRLKGVKANRLYIIAGDTTTGGHCYLAYRPKQYPLNYVFLDWCYNPILKSIESRNKFYVTEDNQVKEYNSEGIETNSIYAKVWFAFNEDKGFRKLTGE